MKNPCRNIIAAVALSLALAGNTRAENHASPFGLTAGLVEHDGAQLVEFHFTMPPDHVLYASRLKFETPEGVALTPVTIPQPSVHVDAHTGKEKEVYDYNFNVDLKLDVAAPMDVVVKFQGCSNSACYFPEKHAFKVSSAGVVAMTEPTENPATPTDAVAQTAADSSANLAGFTIAARETGFVSKGDLIQFLDAAKKGVATSGGLLAKLGELGLASTLILIVLGGLGLNFTPCVLPMIPINLAIIGAGAQASSRKRGFALGAVYGGGMALVYGVLGLFVVLTGSKFGTLNSSPWFNLAIAAVFILMALAMFDIINVDFSRFQRGGGSGGAKKSQFVIAFTVGMIAALLAGACVAPVVISVLLLATQLYGKGIVAGLMLPFLLGLGMALPWPFAGAGLSFLPKPGKWMKYVKYSFGVLILLFAGYYGYLGGGLYLSQHPMLVQARALHNDAAPTVSANEALNQALLKAKAEGRPVFIDFAASWCKNCEAMDAAVFPAQEVKDKLNDFVVVRYDAEKPNESPAREILDKFGVMGLPTYVVLKPQN